MAPQPVQRGPDLTAGDVALEWFVESVPDALVIVGPDGRIQLANSRMTEVFGYTREEFVGLPIEALIPERLRSGHEREREVYAKKPHDRPMGSGIDIRALRKDGSEFPADVQLRPRRGPNGVMTIAAVRDMSGREELERKRRELEARAEHARHLERLVQLAGGIAHECNHLLAAILSNANDALKDLLESSPIRPHLTNIEKAARRATDLTQQLVGVFRPGKALGSRRAALRGGVQVRRVGGEQSGRGYCPAYPAGPASAPDRGGSGAGEGPDREPGAERDRGDRRPGG